MSFFLADLDFLSNNSQTAKINREHNKSVNTVKQRKKRPTNTAKHKKQFNKNTDKTTETKITNNHPHYTVNSFVLGEKNVTILVTVSLRVHIVKRSRSIPTESRPVSCLVTLHCFAFCCSLVCCHPGSPSL